jgi:hypothetical protein
VPLRVSSQLPERLFANGLYFALYALQFLLCAFKRLVGTLQHPAGAFALALRRCNSS